MLLRRLGLQHRFWVVTRPLTQSSRDDAPLSYFARRERERRSSFTELRGIFKEQYARVQQDQKKRGANNLERNAPLLAPGSPADATEADDLRSLDPWHISRIELVLEKLDAKLSTDTVRAQLPGAGLLRPHLALFRQAHAKGAPLLSLLSIFQSLLDVAATLPGALAIAGSDFNLLLSALVHHGGVRQAEVVMEHALRAGVHGLNLNHLLEGWLKERRYLMLFQKGMPLLASIGEVPSLVPAIDALPGGDAASSIAACLPADADTVRIMLLAALETRQTPVVLDLVNMLCDRSDRFHPSARLLETVVRVRFAYLPVDHFPLPARLQPNASDTTRVMDCINRLLRAWRNSLSAPVPEPGNDAASSTDDASRFISQLESMATAFGWPVATDVHVVLNSFFSSFLSASLVFLLLF